MSHKLHLGNCVSVMFGFDDDSIDAIVTDPPYGLEFMGKDWDSFGREKEYEPRGGYNNKGILPGYGRGGTSEQRELYRRKSNNNFQVWCEEWAAECLRVLKPGGHILVFGGSRTYHRLACAIEDAGFEIRDQIMWLYGQGFPKSLDVSKAIDKAAGATREVVGTKLGKGGENLNQLSREGAGDAEDAKGCGAYGLGAKQVDIEIPVTIPASEESRKWNGWGTALKPAHEPIVLARKPLIGTVAANVLLHGTGGLNIDACRVPGEPVPINKLEKWSGFGQEKCPDYEATVNDQGRWPANLIHDGSDEVLAAFPNAPGQLGPSIEDGADQNNTIYGKMKRGGPHHTPRNEEDKTAARFFMTCRGDEPSADKTYEDTGATNFAMKPGARREATTPSSLFYTAKVSKKERQEGLGDLVNNHPTLKPIALMRYLCRLVTPPGGTVLDPFAGSGSTGKAAILEGFDFVGIEKDPEYYAIAERRISGVHPEV